MLSFFIIYRVFNRNLQLLKSIIYVGFATWAVGCGVLSTITESTKKAVLVVFMLVSGIGGGQVRSSSLWSRTTCSTFDGMDDVYNI